MPRSGQQGQAHQQMAGLPSALVQSKEQTKPSSKTQPVTAKATQPVGKQGTVETDRRPPDPGLRPEAGPGPKLSKVTTILQVHGLPNIPRPSSSQLYLFRHGFSPNRSLSTQSGPTPADSNNPGHGNDSNLPICPPSSVRAPVRDGLLGGQPRGQPVRVQHLPGHASTPSFTQSCGTSISGTSAMQTSDYTSYEVTTCHLSDFQCMPAETTLANVWRKVTIGVNLSELKQINQIITFRFGQFLTSISFSVS